MTTGLMRPRGGDLSQVVFPPVQADLFRVEAPHGHAPVLWCDGQHAHYDERFIDVPAPASSDGPRLSELFAAALAHEVQWHR